ncbi:MAG: hypothetical protein GEV09_19195 [Pseudonocardiaceae bacterium]|nr:hypothetical protein [Pseudonocardiaceae bacterium]
MADTLVSDLSPAVCAGAELTPPLGSSTSIAAKGAFTAYGSDSIAAKGAFTASDAVRVPFPAGRGSAVAAKGPFAALSVERSAVSGL